MGIVICCFKIFLYRNQISILSSELLSLQKLVLFDLKVFIKKWFECPSSIKAAFNDIEYLKEIVLYESIDKNISNVAFLTIPGILVKAFVG